MLPPCQYCVLKLNNFAGKGVASVSIPALREARSPAFRASSADAGHLLSARCKLMTVGGVGMLG